jgi:hypothetical protein
MQHLLEREVVLRCMKHILSKYIRECHSSELLAGLVSHILNCLLAPKDFQKRMDDGVIVFEKKTLSNMAKELNQDSENQSGAKENADK